MKRAGVSSDKGWLTDLAKRLRPRPITLPRESLDFWRAVFLRDISIGMTILLVLYGGFNFAAGNLLFGVSDGLILFVFYYSGYRLDDAECIRKGRNIFVFSNFLLATIILANSSPGIYTIIWIASTSVIIAFLYDMKNGLRVNLLFLALVLVLFASKPRADISLYEMFAFACAMLILFVLLFLHEQSREAAVTALHENADLLYRTSVTDRLTLLYNRLYIEQLIFAEFAERKAKGVCPEWNLIIIDVDRFKQINDTFGHLRGDKVLRMTARALSSALEKSGTLARWGGDEFLVSLRGTDHAAALRIAENLRASVRRMGHEGDPPVSISLGVASCHADDDYDSFLKRADDCMYEAKKAGGNRIVSEKRLPLPEVEYENAGFEDPVEL